MKTRKAMPDNKAIKGNNMTSFSLATKLPASIAPSPAKAMFINDIISDYTICHVSSYNFPHLKKN